MKRSIVLGVSAMSVMAISTTVQASTIPVTAFGAGDTLLTFDDPIAPTASASYHGLTITPASSTVSTATYGNMYNFPGASGGAALYDNVYTTPTDLVIHFGTSVARAGMLLAGGNSNTSWTVQVRDASNAVLESSVVTFTVSVGFPNDPPVFIGFERPAAEIASIRIIETSSNGQYTGIDDVRFGGLPPTLLRTTELGVGDATCPYGGILVETGLDNGDGGGTAGDGILSDGEVDQSDPICNGGDGFGSLIDTTTIPSGDATCPAGGVQIDVGIDNGDGGGIAGDGILQPGEIDDTSKICNGTDGTDGTNGADGMDGMDGMNGADGMDGANGGCSVTPKGSASGATLLGLAALVVLGRRRRRRR